MPSGTRTRHALGGEPRTLTRSGVVRQVTAPPEPITLRSRSTFAGGRTLSCSGCVGLPLPPSTARLRPGLEPPAASGRSRLAGGTPAGMDPCWPESSGLVRTGTPDEAQERRSELVRRLFGMVLPAVDRAAAQLAGRPRPPDRLGIAVDVQVVIRRDEQQTPDRRPAARSASSWARSMRKPTR